MSSEDDQTNIVEISIDKIKPNPWQGRIYFDEHSMETLAQSIKIHGLQQPPTGRKHPRKLGYVELATGERRVRACKMLGWKKVPLIIKNLSDRKMITINLAENLERKGINAIEEARQYQRLVNEYGYNHQRIADEFGKSRSHITNRLGLLTTDLFIQEAVIHDLITPRHARAIKQLPKKYLQYKIVDIVLDFMLTVPETEAVITQTKENRPYISWTREIPTDSIIVRHNIKSARYYDYIKTSENDVQVDNIGVLITGDLFYGLREYLAAVKNKRAYVKADIHYPVAYLLDHGLDGYPVGKILREKPLVEMFPQKNNKQRDQMKKFLKRLKEIVDSQRKNK